MCRLYGFSANEPTKVECTLVHAQNALLTQSAEDQSGKSHASGWGVVTYEHETPHLERQAWAAYHGEHFKRAAAKIYAKRVLAHIRRATVGPPSPENTHPFISGNWSFVHNGTVPGFQTLRPRLLEMTAPQYRGMIQGQTDSEHVFAYILTLFKQHPGDPLGDLLRRAALDIAALAAETTEKSSLGLNMMITDGQRLCGTRLGRSLHYVERKGVYDCEICGFPHIHHHPKTDYWAIVIASEPITHENWIEIPDRSVWQADPVTQSLQLTPF